MCWVLSITQVNLDMWVNLSYCTVKTFKFDLHNSLKKRQVIHCLQKFVTAVILSLKHINIKLHIYGYPFNGLNVRQWTLPISYITVCGHSWTQRSLGTATVTHYKGSVIIMYCTVAGWSHFNRKPVRAEVLYNH